MQVIQYCYHPTGKANREGKGIDKSEEYEKKERTRNEIIFDNRVANKCINENKKTSPNDIAIIINLF